MQWLAGTQGFNCADHFCSLGKLFKLMGLVWEKQTLDFNRGTMTINFNQFP